MPRPSYRNCFKGTAPYFARFRLPYPEPLYDLLRPKFGLDGTHRLLDLGCGTGTIALALRDDFEEVIGIDPEPELTGEAEAIAAKADAKNVRSLVAGSEDLAEMRQDLGTFRLVTIGNAFHWMNRAATLQILHEIVEPGGGVAVLGGETLELSPREQNARFRQPLRNGSGKCAGQEAVRTNRQRSGTRRSSRALPSREWSSTRSTLSTAARPTRSSEPSTRPPTARPYVLGTKREAFERDLRDALGRLSPGGSFTQNERFGAILAWKR